jgi:hypothetical protein
MYNDDFHRHDDIPSYNYHVNTLDQDTALAMTLEKFEAEMQRLQIRARRAARRPAHRRALENGAVRLTRASGPPTGLA